MDFNGAFDRYLYLQVDEYYGDENEAQEAFELFEAFTFGGLRYLLTGTYDGGNLEGGRLFLCTHWGLIEQYWCETDSITEAGYDFKFAYADSLTARCYDVADAALKSWEAA